MPRQRSGAFIFFELLVVIAILVPAIQSACEVARRMSCSIQLGMIQDGDVANLPW